MVEFQIAYQQIFYVSDFLFSEYKIPLLAYVNLIKYETLNSKIFFYKFKVVSGHEPVYLTRGSKRNFARRNKTSLGPRRQAETSLKIEDLRANKSTCNEMMAFLVTLYISM